MAFESVKEKQAFYNLRFAHVQVGHSFWMWKSYDPKNTKLTVPAEIASHAKMKDREAYHVAMPENTADFDAVVYKARELFAQGSMVIFYIFSGKEEGKV